MILATLAFFLPCARGQLEERNHVVIELFLRRDSEQCQRAQAFVSRLQSERPGLDVRMYDIIEDRESLARLWKLSKRFGREKPGVPTVYLVDRLIVGYRDAQTTGRTIEALLQIEAFVRPGCRHCQEAKRFLDALCKRWPAVRVSYHNVVADASARAEVARLAQKYKVRVASFPCIRVAGRLVVGFRSAETTGRQIEDMFTRQRVAPGKGTEINLTKREGRSLSQRAHFSPVRLGIASVAASLATVLQETELEETALTDSQHSMSPRPLASNEFPLPDDVPFPEEMSLPEEVPLPAEVPLPDEPEQYAGQDDVLVPETDPHQAVEVPVFGRLRVKEIGLPAFTFLIGLVDGFNPCAMWVLVFLLSVLVRVKERKKIIVIAGTFVMVSGLAYFAFMAAWFNVFQLIGLLRPVQISLGLVAIVVGLINVKDFFAFHEGVTLSIPESAKPGIYRRVREIVAAKHLTVALLGAMTLAVVVNIVELLCTAGLPALYTEILTMQDLPNWMNYSYLGMYIVAYMLDDALLVTVVVITLSHHKLQEAEGRWLKLISGCVILLLGVVMVFKPEWLV